jgi:hypothetical protein
MGYGLPAVPALICAVDLDFSTDAERPSDVRETAAR